MVGSKESNLIFMVSVGFGQSIACNLFRNGSMDWSFNVFAQLLLLGTFKGNKNEFQESFIQKEAREAFKLAT